MEFNVGGTVVDMKLVLGIDDNRPTDWTYEILEGVMKGRDENGNIIVDIEDYKVMRALEKELKKNNQFSFKLNTGSLKELYRKVVKENQTMKKSKLATVISKEITKHARARYTQRQLKQMVADGIAIDITTMSYSDVYKLHKEEQLEPIGSSYGIYGPNGRLYKGKSGKLYAVTARNNTLDQLPF